MKVVIIGSPHSLSVNSLISSLNISDVDFHVDEINTNSDHYGIQLVETNNRKYKRYNHPNDDWRGEGKRKKNFK